MGWSNRLLGLISLAYDYAYLARDFWQSYRVIQAGFTDLQVSKQLERRPTIFHLNRVRYANSKQPQQLTIREGPRDQRGAPYERLLLAPFAIPLLEP